MPDSLSRITWGERRLPRFTTGALLVLILVCALPLAYIAQRRGKNTARLAAFEALSKKGIVFDIELPPVANGREKERTWWQQLISETPKFTGAQISDRSFQPQSAPTIGDDDLRKLLLFPEIERLKIAGADFITDRGLSDLAALPKVKSLHAAAVQHLDGSFLTAWARTNRLESLEFEHLDQLEGRHLGALGKMTSLTALTLRSCANLTQTSLAGVDLPGGLTTLRIESTPVEDEALSRWLAQTNLRILVLDTAFTRTIASELAYQQQLSQLSITNAPLLDEDLMFLGRCPSLYNLSLVGLPVRGAFLKRISPRSQLDFLTLRAAPLSDEYASHLAKLPRLIHLDLAWTSIEGDCFAGASWPMLNTLNLQGTRFSEQGKKNLANIEFKVNGTVNYPANWTPLDLKLNRPSPGLIAPVLSGLYAGEVKANSIPGVSYYAPQPTPPDFSRCPEELMTPVRNLIHAAQKDLHSTKD